jgi:hypothetical protein
MTLGFGEQGRRKQRWRRRARFIFFTIVVGAVAAVAFDLGSMRTEQAVASRDQEIAQLQESETDLKGRLGVLKETLASAEARGLALEDRYKRDVPSGPVKKLAALVRDRLERGIDPARLAEVISKTRNKQDCDRDPATRRFLVRTPLAVGANHSVSFARNTITVTGRGRAARDPNGNPEAWFDPAKTIDIQFVRVGGESSQISGRLPLHHTMVVGDFEFRFSVVEGTRGFIKVVGSRCRYP